MGNTLSRCFGGKRDKPKVAKTSKRRRKLTAMEIVMFSEVAKDQTVQDVSGFYCTCLFLYSFSVYLHW
jgi:hypothetical protein